ncbi:AsmA family protein [Bradyrhizobium sp. AUGA SZCCT0240]|uniref:AsmA family protein n=1 Tax=unclassified Bradyrhizobium TaxID=2631580 RepID=UPI001BAB019A|nr:MULTISPECIES: AsmA family protein [unclassified Bradyrhizobium]MBR1200981.1 AsmA family protein [Bradyrhizobium sp. AUGA SZCCT0158]MBR1258838.1 AsmA family protein [Bradyrhizobium sp. AUGA SZCCT0240]
MRALKFAGAAIGAVIVIIGLLLVIGIPSGFMTSQIQERVQRETGYKLTINGGTRVGLWPSLNITVNDVALQDPKDRDINHRLTAASIQADVTLASLWSGKPQVTELVIVRPVLNLPLQRERIKDINPPSKPAAAIKGEAFTIEHVSVTGGTIVFSNLRDRVENKIETINADMTIDAGRKIRATGNARAGEHALKFDIKAVAPAPPLERQNIPTEFKVDAPGFLHGQLSGKAEVRLNGPVVMINGLTGTLGDGAFNGWASVDTASKPLVKLDLDFQRLDVAMGRGDSGSAAQPWSNETINLNGLNYVDAQARISAAALNVGDARFAPAAIDVTLNSGVLKTQVSNLGAYDGNTNGDLTIDASTSNPSFALRADLNGVRALPLLRSLADFDKLDGKMQTKISVRSTGNSQRAIMAGLQGTAFVVFQDGAIKGLNVAQMIRSLTSGTLSGWQEGKEQSTDLSQLSASFKIDKGQAVTTDLNLIGPLVRMTGVGTIALDTKQIGFRVEPKLVMTTEGQGRTNEPVGFGIPVMIEGPWGAPKIYPDMQGILDNPDAAYAKLKEMGKGLFGPNGGGLGSALGGLLGGQQGVPGGQPGGPGGQQGSGLEGILGGLLGGGQPGGQGGQGSGRPNDPLGGQLGEAIGNLLQQGLNSGQGGQGRPAQGSAGQAAPRPNSPRSIPIPGQQPADAEPAAPAAPTAQNDGAPQTDSQPMNDVLRQLFNR